MAVFHRFDTYGPACGVHDGVNGADMEPPEVTCKRCLKVGFSTFDRRHYARKDGRTFIVNGFAPDPTRPWKAEYQGALA